MWGTTLFVLISSSFLSSLVSLSFLQFITYASFAHTVSKVEDPGQGLVGVRGEAPELASNVRDLMQIHQREHHRVEHRQHLSHRWEADAAIILP